MDSYTGFTFLTVMHLASTLGNSDHAPPFFISEPHSTAVAEGQNVTLTCEAGPIGKVNVRWTYNGSEIHPQSRKGITIMGSSLHIASFVSASESGQHPSSHAGIYRCVAQNKVGAIVSRPVALTSARLESCHQKLVHESVSVSVGNTVILPCRGITKPSSSLEVVFELNGAALKTSSRHKLLPSHSLQIENTTSSDAGTYRCICPSSFPPHRIVASIVQLKVEAASKAIPSAFIWKSPRDVQVIEGQTLTLECAAAGWPVPLITWLRYGGVLPTSRHSQHIGKYSSHQGSAKVDEGTYICRAENTAGPPQIHVVFVDVLQPPKILLAPTDHTVTEGARVTLGCKAEGSPRPTVMWYHNALPVINSSLSKTNADGALVLMDVQENQSGMYQCIVSNLVNSSSASARLTIRRSATTSLGLQRNGPIDKNRSLAIPLRRTTVAMPNQPLDFPGGEVESYSQEPDTRTAKDSPDGEETKSLLMQSDGERSSHKKTKGPRTYPRNKPRKTSQKNQKNAGVSLVPPSKPTVSLVSDTSVQLKWSIGQSEGLNVTLFKVQFKEIKTRKHRKSAGWHTIDEDIAPDVSEFTVSNLKPGSTYQFRLVAIYSNNDNKHGPNSDRLLMSVTGESPKVPLTAPIIVAVHPLSTSEIAISWQFMPAKREVINGFMIHYKPYETDLGYKQYAVHGSDEREVLLSSLLVDTTYSLRMQSFNTEGFSDYSNTVVKKTMGPSDNITDHYPLNNYTPLFAPPIYKDRGTIDDPRDPGTTIRSGIESQVPLNRASYSQQNSDLLFVVLGGVLGAVFIVVIFVVVFCFWRQRQQQLLIATLQATAKANNTQHPPPTHLLHANDFSAPVNYEMESVNNAHPDARRKRTPNKKGDIPGYVGGGGCPKGAAGGAIGGGGFRSTNQCCHLYQPTQEEWKSEHFPFMAQSSLDRRPMTTTISDEAYALSNGNYGGSRSDVDTSADDGDSMASSCPAQWTTTSAGDCTAEIYNSELLPFPPPSHPSHPPLTTSFRPPPQHHHLPSKIHQRTMNSCDCDPFSCQPLSTEPLEPSSDDALQKLTDCHRRDEGNNSQSGQSDSLPRSCASDCSSSSSSTSSSCNHRCHPRQQYNRETNDSGVYDETGDCKHHSTADCRTAGDQCQVFA